MASQGKECNRKCQHEKEQNASSVLRAVSSREQLLSAAASNALELARTHRFTVVVRRAVPSCGPLSGNASPVAAGAALPASLAEAAGAELAAGELTSMGVVADEVEG